MVLVLLDTVLFDLGNCNRVQINHNNFLVAALWVIRFKIKVLKKAVSVNLFRPLLLPNNSHCILMGVSDMA